MSDAAIVNVVVGWSGSVTDVAMVDVDGVDATARDVSVTNVNCELTDGVDVSDECEVETLVNVSVDVIDGKLITVPLEVELAVIVELLPLVKVVLFPERVVVMVWLPEAVDEMV